MGVFLRADCDNSKGRGCNATASEFGANSFETAVAVIMTQLSREMIKIRTGLYATEFP